MGNRSGRNTKRAVANNNKSRVTLRMKRKKNQHQQDIEQRMKGEKRYLRRCVKRAPVNTCTADMTSTRSKFSLLFLAGLFVAVLAAPVHQFPSLCHPEEFPECECTADNKTVICRPDDVATNHHINQSDPKAANLTV